MVSKLKVLVNNLLESYNNNSSLNNQIDFKSNKNTKYSYLKFSYNDSINEETLLSRRIIDHKYSQLESNE